MPNSLLHTVQRKRSADWREDRRRPPRPGTSGTWPRQRLHSARCRWASMHSGQSGTDGSSKSWLVSSPPAAEWLVRPPSGLASRGSGKWQRAPVKE